MPILVAASFVFYAYNYPLLLLLLLSSIAINIAPTYSLYRNEDPVKRKRIVTFGVVSNLLVLAFFKYAGLIATSFIGDSGNFASFLISIPLPIGISFFTFQGISLLVDTYRGKDLNMDNMIGSKKKFSFNIAFFIAFFPQLVAGPIVKAHEFLPQIGIKKFQDIAWWAAGKNIIMGYFLKSFIADNMKEFTSWMHFPEFQTQSSLTLISVLLGYSMQIFADFAGYSLIAIGIARLFGYKLMDNFMFPYISLSFSEFWRRWHISLSSFLRDYLYIPLGGNRKSEIRTYFNLFITMVLGGLWHGAAWSYAIWGLFHGIALAIERFVKHKIFATKNTFLNALYGVFVFIGVTFAWLLFQLPRV